MMMAGEKGEQKRIDDRNPGSYIPVVAHVVTNEIDLSNPPRNEDKKGRTGSTPTRRTVLSIDL